MKNYPGMPKQMKNLKHQAGAKAESYADDGARQDIGGKVHPEVDPGKANQEGCTQHGYTRSRLVAPGC